MMQQDYCAIPTQISQGIMKTVFLKVEANIMRKIFENAFEDPLQVPH